MEFCSFVFNIKVCFTSFIQTAIPNSNSTFKTKIMPALTLCLLVLTADNLANILEPGLEVIKHEYSLKLKIKRNDWLLADIVLYFEFENELKFYNLEA